ncbi:PDZ domain-containing protein [Nocardioides speluncae]|uniref:YlbL family protein n=1 Tax=Nocardioides speluncae TaxID=2670337 RepID=UPI000D68884E|nr:PDZ domain-containing protein [Nocardioides speluncae]
MTRRTLAGLIAVALLFGLWLAALVLPLPYVTYSPGITVDVLAEDQGKEIIQVNGHKTYRDDGEIRMTTVYVTQREAHISLFEVMRAWMNDERAVVPFDSVYREGQTQDEDETESAVQMVSSQDAAIAAALRELKVKVTAVTEVLSVSSDMPADGKLKVRDQIVSVNGKAVDSPDDIIKAVEGTPAGKQVTFQVRRKDAVKKVAIKPEKTEDGPKVGIITGPGYDFPFDVSVDIPDSIGGPSAGLMFSLAIYDTLTPGSLTDGEIVAGTGTIDGEGKVGSIGGIQQKIVAARKSGARLFMVPPDNCDDAIGAQNGDMRLVKATTMHDALNAIKSWVKDHDAELPTCTTKG